MGANIKMNIRRRFLASTVLASTALFSNGSRAQTGQSAWPSRPVRLVVPFPPGGASDLLANIAATEMSRNLGQAVKVDNVPGASGNTGADLVAKAAADGYTILLAPIGPFAVNQWLYRSLPYNPITDFDPIGMIATVPNLMVVPTSLPVSNVAEFIDYAKSKGEQVFFGSIGNGTSQHLAGCQFNIVAGTKMVHVPNRSPAALNNELVLGRIQVIFQSISGVVDLVKDGRMKALAVTGTERVEAFPNIPTLREAGVDVTTVGWFGLAAPTNTPKEITSKLEVALRDSLNRTDVASAIRQAGSIPKPGDRQMFVDFISAERARFRDIVRTSGATVE
jgi:tripartite-type tricarboxylate transporter receptor subunit TctC